MFGEFAAPAPCSGAWFGLLAFACDCRQPLLREAARRLLQRALLVGELEVHGRTWTSMWSSAIRTGITGERCASQARRARRRCGRRNSRHAAGRSGGGRAAGLRPAEHRRGCRCCARHRRVPSLAWTSSTGTPSTSTQRIWPGASSDRREGRELRRGVSANAAPAPQMARNSGPAIYRNRQKRNRLDCFL